VKQSLALKIFMLTQILSGGGMSNILKFWSFVSLVQAERVHCHDALQNGCKEIKVPAINVIAIIFSVFFSFVALHFSVS
jgi:hypothetical protein